MDRRIPKGYISREVPEVFIDVPTAIVHQPHVYAFAQYLVERSGCSRVIDIGCGSAEKLAPFDGVVSVTCIDAEIMRPYAARFVPTADFIACDLEKPLPDLHALAIGAVIICSDVIEHLVRPEVLLAALASLSQLAAYVLISTPDRARARGLMDSGPPGNPSHVREWTAEELGRFLLDCGFSPKIMVGYTLNNDHDLAKNTILSIAGREVEFHPPQDPLRVAAVISAFNEADIIENVLRYLQQQKVETHVFDNWSTDETFDIVQRLVDEGVCQHAARYPDAPSEHYEWAAMLEHNSCYAAGLPVDWIIHYDADELRGAPWRSATLQEAIGFVDGLGYSALDFTVLNFCFTDERSAPRFDPEGLKFFDFARHPAHLQQIKAWKNMGPVDLASSAGHLSAFEGRRVYPLKFLTRHYPLRSFEQANRKVFNDRLPRVIKEKTERGWHTHYDTYLETLAIKPWRRFELLNFDPNVFEPEYFVERLSGIGIETEARAIPNIETRLFRAELRR